MLGKWSLHIPNVAGTVLERVIVTIGTKGERNYLTSNIWSPIVLDMLLLHVSDCAQVGSWGGLLLPFAWEWCVVRAVHWFMPLLKWKHSLRGLVIVGVIV